MRLNLSWDGVSHVLFGYLSGVRAKLKAPSTLCEMFDIRKEIAKADTGAWCHPLAHQLLLNCQAYSSMGNGCPVVVVVDEQQ